MIGKTHTKERTDNKTSSNQTEQYAELKSLKSSTNECETFISHYQKCPKCQSKLQKVLSSTNSNQQQRTVSRNNSSTNYKDLAILLAMGVFIILMLDKLKRHRIPTI